MPYTTLRNGGTAVVGDTTTGLIPQGLHPSAAAYLARLVANGFAPSRTQIDAINNLVLGLVANGLWTKMQVIHPIMGGSAATHQWNLKDTTAFPITFTGSWTHTSSGMKPTTAATGNRATFAYNPSVRATNFDAHMSIYLGTNATAATAIAAGVNTSAGGFFQMASGTSAAGAAFYIQSPISPAVGVTFTFAPGNIIASRTSSTLLKGYLNGTLKGTNTTAVTGIWPNDLLTLACGVSNGAFSFPTDQRYQFITVGTGLTDLEARILTTLVQAYQTSLGRQV